VFNKRGVGVTAVRDRKQTGGMEGGGQGLFSDGVTDGTMVARKGGEKQIE